jgi:hypothetical protein
MCFKFYWLKMTCIFEKLFKINGVFKIPLQTFAPQRLILLCCIQ